MFILDSGRKWSQEGDYIGDWWTNNTVTAYDDVKKCMVNVYTNITQGPVTAPNGKTVYVGLQH